MQRNRATPDPEVPAKATRRRFSAVEKARILDEYDRASAIERAAVCRRERIYTSHLSNWRKQRAAGAPLEAKRGRKPEPQGIENTRLRKENTSLTQRLAKAERVIDMQGKAYGAPGEADDNLQMKVLPDKDRSWSVGIEYLQTVWRRTD